MTGGLDRRWRDATARRVVQPGDTVLDAACGTGDLALADLRAGAARVVGVDFSEQMLERAARKSSAIEWVQGDLCKLSFADGSFQAVTIGFGLRNVADREGALRELRRVLAPGGRLGILEITRVRGPLAPFFRDLVRGPRPACGETSSRRLRLRLSPRQRAPLPRSEGARRPDRAGRIRGCPVQTAGGGIMALHVGVAR